MKTLPVESGSLRKTFVLKMDNDASKVMDILGDVETFGEMTEDELFALVARIDRLKQGVEWFVKEFQ